MEAQKNINTNYHFTRSQKQLNIVGAKDKDPLICACKLIGNALNVKMIFPENLPEGNNSKEAASCIAKYSHLRIRMVFLRSDWWRQDGSNLLAYLKDGQAVALIKKSPGSYYLHDSEKNCTIRIDAKVNSLLQPFAYEFYVPFPDSLNRPLDILKFAYSCIWKRDLFTVFVIGILGSILGLCIPVLTGIIYSKVIPDGDFAQLFSISFVILSISCSIFMFELIRNIAMLRLEGKIDLKLQAAIWDRLLKLHADFFRNYSSGDLTDRANCISTIQKSISGMVINTILNSLFSIVYLYLLFFYSIRLALAAVLLSALALTVTVYNLKLQKKLSFKSAETEGQYQGLLFQLIEGFAKFRASGTERQAFGLWAKKFTELRKRSLTYQTIGLWLNAFHIAFPTFASIVIYLLMVFYESDNLSTGNFLAFFSAFFTFLYSLMGFSQVSGVMIFTMPLFERARPIFEAPIEACEQRSAPGKLSGKISVSNISFSYNDSKKKVLENISLEVGPGEMAAIVGPSGSGKSTLLRLLLGFNTPKAGLIQYDGMDISKLDLQALRCQIGIVLQNSKVMSGDILTNIIGSSNFTIDDAWNAAKMAGLDKDIESMPMGMHTFVSNGGSTLSGGQCQRLLIARALIRKPNIIFLDEATSALDNLTQRVVMDSLSSFNITRIIIAHRLSTIINADKIYVMEKGQIVQSGTYDELINQEGAFLQLAKRQII